MRALIVGLVLALPLAFAPQAGAFIYWTGPNADGTASQIGRANLDGSNPQPGFIGIGSFQADSVAVDAHHIYWANMSLPPGLSGVGTIAVANLDGSGVRERLVTTNGIPGGVGVHGGYVYWGESGGIWRARKSGGREHPLVAAPHRGHTFYPFSPGWLAFDRKHVYWSDNVGRVGRANLDGSHVNYKLVRSVDPSAGIAVAGGHVYWFSKDGRIGRANVNGSGANPRFISTGIAGDVTACGLAAFGNELYWLTSTSSGTPGAVGRTRLDGSNPTPNLVTVGFACGLAVDGRG